MNGATLTIVFEVQITMDVADDSASRVEDLVRINSWRMRTCLAQRFDDMERCDVAVLATTTVAR